MTYALVVALLASVASGPAPTNQQLLFFNARTALREQRATDVLKLWLVRNSLEQRGEQSAHDGDFRSALWAALGTLGYCQDGIAQDGAGLWPLALHNWLVQVSGKPARERPPPWQAFKVGRQQRFISLNDVLSAEELRSAAFSRTWCAQPYVALAGVKSPRWLDLKDRLSVSLLMRDLLELSPRTLDRDKVENLAVIEARIFDLDLAIADLQRQRARREAGVLSQLARSVGLSEPARAELRDEVTKRWPQDSKQAELLRRSLTWSPRAWLDLSQARRLALFVQAKPLATDEAKLASLVLGIIDELIAHKAGGELQSFIGLLDAADAPMLRSALVRGERGQLLLGLEPATGFRERAVVALHRGVDFLQSGSRDEALRSFAYALGRAEESRSDETTHALARRWLSYVLSQYETTDSVLSTLKALVPRQDYHEIVEELAWRAALRADAVSFERAVAGVPAGASLAARIEELRPLARGRPGEMATLLRDRAQQEPHSVLRFIRVLLDQLEKENATVRRAHIATLELILEVLAPLASRKTTAVVERVQAILDGLGQLELLKDAPARAMSPSREPYAGSIRLAPADPLPWPFQAPQVETPSAFAPLLLQPVEWRDDKGALVFGWRLTE